MKLYILILLSFLSFKAFCQDEDLQFVKKEFGIVYSTRDYAAALKKAGEASRKLKLPLKLRGLKPNKETGLSESKTICEDEFGFFPCYVPRGRYDDGLYISIEYSDAYLEFEKSWYIVVVSGYESGNKKSKEQLIKTKKIYKDAYLKTSKVYIGCIH